MVNKKVLRYKKYLYENVFEVDPFDEENWNEVDSFVTIFKIRIGARTKTITLTFFPAKIELIDNEIIVWDNMNNKILENSKDLVIDKLKKGIRIGNMFLIHNDFIDNTLIKNFIIKYLNNKKMNYEQEILNIKNEIEEENGDYYELNDQLDKYNTLLYNIENFDVSSEVDKMIKLYFNK